MKNKLLVIGSGGLIGHQIFNYLKKSNDYEIFDISKSQKIQKNTILLDARDENLFFNKLLEINPNYIINCLGVLIEESEADPENAIYLNSYIPHKLAKFSNAINSKLIHISTDCVFSGDKKKPYTETDEKDGRSIYSKTKSLGEVIDKKNLTLRTSVVGPQLNDNVEELFHWFMKQTDCISGYTKAIWSGVTTLELAKAVKWAIDTDLTGLYHVTNNNKISKYELLKLFQKFTQKDIKIKKVDGIDIDRSFIDTRLLLNYEIPSYEQMICDMVSIIADNKTLYSQYRVENFDKK